MKNKITKLTGLLIILVFVVLACSGKKEEKIEDKGAGKIKDTIVYGISSSPTGIFNPLISDTVYDDAVNTMVYDSLLKLDKEQKLVPSMAESYEVSKDGLELTFKLKDNIKFSDGTPVTAKDVEFTLTSLADKDYPGELGDYISKVVGVN
ncbi:MAG: ABC transporter substrate-binding protein, partial [Pseudoleptotrichia goodfellowii]|nr:ABC transporter substrate-binding protein [Pseudoleptotrichia goodfellowii]